MKLYKSLLFLGASALLLTACGSENENDTEVNNTDVEVEENEVNEVSSESESETKEEDEEESYEFTLKPEGEVQFSEFSAYISNAKIFEEDEEYYADLIVTWVNESSNDDINFMMNGYFEAYQNEELLELRKNNDADLARNANSLGSLPMDAKYTLINNEDPIHIRFGSLMDNDKNNQEIIIELE